MHQTRAVLRLILCAALAAPVVTAPVFAQTPAAPATAAAQEENPLAALNEQLKTVLATAGVPFTPDQERAIALMMEERRRASEELFGNLMDFRDGPTQGEDEDRLRSAIDWLRGEFIRSLALYLTAEQAIVWRDFQAQAPALPDGAPVRPAAPPQTQYVRINNNAFTSENNGFSTNTNTDVIQRGGLGAWHGNAEFQIQDDALNARNAFAGNKPPYQERLVAVNVSGPAIARRLTAGVSFTQRESENVGTVRATLPDGVFALGITRPYVYREVTGDGRLQLAPSHSIGFWGRRAAESNRGQGMGDFTLPERRSDRFWNGSNLGLYPFSAFSNGAIHEARLQINTNRNETIPFSDAVRINVLDAFNAGGAQNQFEEANRSYEFGNLFTRVGDKLTVKTGVEGTYRAERSITTDNFGGTFTFSSLQDYLAGTPLNYRVTRGNPELEFGQLEMGAFVQTDVAITSQLTVMLGMRYEAQQNLPDYNNFDPRVGFAYAPGQATVIRGGGGIFRSRLQTNHIENLRRFDGTRQLEIVIESPSYPDPFAAGIVQETVPSVRVMDPAIVAPYVAAGMISLERTFFSNLLVTATYDVQREHHKLRTRNINTPFDTRFEVRRACVAETPADACVRPDPTRGNVISLESTGNDIKHTLRLNLRKRFSIFNGTFNYQAQRVRGDVQGGAGTLSSNAWDVRSDWGRSPQPTHTASATLNASLPLGLFISGAMAYNSGRFYTITTGQDDNRDSNVNDRPPGVGWFTEPGPRYVNFDFNVSKAFFLRRAPGSTTSGTNVNVFVNMRNAFNHVHYGTPSGVLTSPNFGRSINASDPREIEAGVRFQF